MLTSQKNLIFNVTLTDLICFTLSLCNLAPVPSPSAASLRPEIDVSFPSHNLCKSIGLPTLTSCNSNILHETISWLHWRSLAYYSPFFNRVADNKPLDEYIFCLPETMDSVVSLRFGGVIPGQVQARIVVKWWTTNDIAKGRTENLLDDTICRHQTGIVVGLSVFIYRMGLESAHLSPTPPHLVLKIRR